jgi:hypothetical protein
MPILRLTAGQLLVNEQLPPELRDYKRTLDKQGLKTLLSEVAQRYPEKYRDVSFALNKIGRRVALESGGNSFGLDHLSVSPVARKAREEIQKKLDAIDEDDSLDDNTRDARVLQVLKQYRNLPDKILEESHAQDNPLARQVLSVGRGDKHSLASLRGMDLTYVDPDGNLLPIPILKSYSEGLSPVEYWAASYGARAGLIKTKFATADAGYLSKRMSQAAHRLVVTGHDEPAADDTLRGMPTDTSDEENEGSLLAAPTSGYPRNTVITPKILSDLRRKKVNRIIVRSPIVGGAKDGGLLSHDVGVREHGTLAQPGSLVGLTASQALSEPLSQGQLCLAAGTLVQMADLSIKFIEHIEPGEWVLGADADCNTFPVRVLNKFDNGLKQCQKYVFRWPFKKETEEVWCTPDHKILSLRRYYNCANEKLNHTPILRPISESAPEERFTACLPDGYNNSQLFDEPMARLVGWWLGDGIRVLHNTGVMVSCFEDDLAESMQEEASLFRLSLTKMKGHPGQYYVGQVKDNAERNDLGQFMAGFRNPLKKWLFDQGYAGKYAHEKVLPPDVDQWSNKSVAELIAGLWSSDGSVFLPTGQKGKPYLSIGSTSLLLINKIYSLLRWRFGIYSSGPYRNDSEGRKHAMYNINITQELSIKRFLEVIPLVTRKKKILEDAVATWMPKRPRNGRYGLIRLNSEEVGMLPTFDLEVDHPAHLFVLANGLIVSNSSKHAGGVAGSSALKSVSGFDLINQFVEVPKTFRGGATHAQADGTVQLISDAPAGGKYVMIDGQQHYVPTDVGLKVKKGDTVEAGDVLSDGIPNPAEIVRHKGVGEGRRYFAHQFRGAFRDAGINAHRRNTELMARGLIDHVRLNQEYQGWLPNDVVSYQTLEHHWEPREGSQELEPRHATGKYLEKPVLHYSIGTKIRPSVQKDLDAFGVKKISVHDEPPPFEPEMIRGSTNLHHDPDWIVKMFGSGLKTNLLKDVHRGATSDEMGTSFVPSLAKGTDFGLKGKLVAGN